MLATAGPSYSPRARAMPGKSELVDCTTYQTGELVDSTVKPAIVTTCIQRPPLFKDHLVVSQLWLYNSFLPLLRDHLYSKTTFFWSKRGRLIQVSLYHSSKGVHSQGTPGGSTVVALPCKLPAGRGGPCIIITNLSPSSTGSYGGADNYGKPQ